MLNRYKTVLAATLIAASQLAAAATASADVSISNLTLSASGGELWYSLPTEVSWVSQTAGASSALLNPSFDDSVVGWHGNALSASVTDQQSWAKAGMTAKTSGDLNGVTAFAAVQANNGQSGWAFSKVLDGQILVGGNATITVSALLDGIHVSGSMGQANAYIQLCSTDFVTDTCDSANYVEAFIDASSPNYSGPNLLTASWTNPGATTWAKIHIGLTASADAVSAIPEPATLALWLVGLAGVGVGANRRHRKQ